MPPATIDVDVSDPQRFDRMHDRLESRSADAIDGLGRHIDREPGLQRRLPRDVHAGAGLQHTAEHDVADVRRRDAGARERLADDDGPEIGGRHVFQRAAKRSDRRPARAQDDGVEVVIQMKYLPQRSRGHGERIV